MQAPVITIFDHRGCTSHTNTEYKGKKAGNQVGLVLNSIAYTRGQTFTHYMFLFILVLVFSLFLSAYFVVSCSPSRFCQSFSFALISLFNIYLTRILTPLLLSSSLVAFETGRRDVGQGADAGSQVQRRQILAGESLNDPGKVK
jgi:heme/copper-type cytochrome/quinol oxidase subunit 3